MELLAARGELHPCARRMAKHATHHATKRGHVGDLEDELIPGYKARHGIARRSAYADLGRLVDAGLLRQTRAACPGRSVGYQMCVPTTLPADLPASLGAALRRLWGRPTGEDQEQAAVQPSRPPVSADQAIKVRIPVAERHRLLAACEAVRLGASCWARPLDSQPSCGRLHTFPLLKRALHHPSQPGVSPPAPRPPLPGLGEINKGEGGLVGEVLHRCQQTWRYDRGPAGGLDDQAAARLAPLVRGALRYLASADVTEAMTSGTRTARDLGAVVATRLRRVIHAGRRAANRPVDDDGTLYAQIAAQRAAERHALHQATAAARQRARDELAAVRARKAHTSTPTPPQRAARPTPAPHRQEQPTADPAQVLDPADLRLLQQAIDNARHGVGRSVADVHAYKIH